MQNGLSLTNPPKSSVTAAVTVKPRDFRLAALGRFAIAITFVNLLGHFFLGFEQSWAQPVVGLATAYTVEFVLELLSAWGERRPLRFLGGWHNFLSFILPAHITGLAVPMLLYSNEALWPIAMGVAIGIGSKYLFRVKIGNASRHFFNPSNTGIAATLLIFPWVGIAPPYHFTEHVAGFWDWAIPGIIILSGSYLNWGLTRKMPLILGWLSAFAGQAVIRSVLTGAPITATLLPMTGVAFILFTFYMVSDPGTTPTDPKLQVLFGASVAVVYSLLVTAHVVFGIFFSLFIVCTVRGLWIYGRSVVSRRMPATADARHTAVARGVSS
jgi:hypothetical protein